MPLDYGIKISQTGTDITTGDETKLIMTTNSGLLKVALSGATTASGGGTFTEITHSLGYVPQFLAYIEDPVTAGRMNLGTASVATNLAKADTTKLYVLPFSGAGTFDVYYYIFYEPADTGTAPSVTSTSDYGIKVTKDGYDVATANILQQTFNSQKNCLKIAGEGTSSYTGTGGSITIAHGLAYIPAWLVWFEVAGSGNWFTQYTKEHLSNKNVKVSPYTDGTNLVADITMDSSTTVKIYYVLFVDPVE